MLHGFECGMRFPAHEDRTSSRIVFTRWKAPATTALVEAPTHCPDWNVGAGLPREKNVGQKKSRDKPTPTSDQAAECADWNDFHRASTGAATKRDYVAKNVSQNEVGEAYFDTKSTRSVS